MDEFAPVLFISIEVLILIMITPNEVLITKNLWIMSPLSPNPFLFHSPSHTSSNPKIVKIPDLKWLMHTNKRSLQAVVIAIQQLQSICLFLTLLSLLILMGGLIQKCLEVMCVMCENMECWCFIVF